jgi:integrase
MASFHSFVDLTRNVICVLDYKTKTTYDTWEKQLDKNLIQIIKDSITKQPRNYLFVQADGKPFTNPRSFANFTNRIFKKYLDKHVSLNAIRHAAAKNNLINPDKSVRELHQYAADMGHSFSTHELYKLKKPLQS